MRSAQVILLALYVMKPLTINNKNYLYVGSKGAGFSIDRGITTTVEIYDSKQQITRFQLMKLELRMQKCQNGLLEEYLKLINRSHIMSILNIELVFPLALDLVLAEAAALSLSYALNDALNIGLDRNKTAQIAHHGDIACKTGLGTVIAESVGGFEMRTSIGAPGIGTLEKIDLKDHKAIILCISPISTKSYLNSHIDLVDGACRKDVKEVKNNKRH